MILHLQQFQLGKAHLNWEQVHFSAYSKPELIQRYGKHKPFLEQSLIKNRWRNSGVQSKPLLSSGSFWSSLSLGSSPSWGSLESLSHLFGVHELTGAECSWTPPVYIAVKPLEKEQNVFIDLLIKFVLTSSDYLVPHLREVVETWKY